MGLFNIKDSSAARKKIRTVGIDFGTTNSLVAYSQDGVAKIIADVHDRTLIPSIVVFHKDYHTVSPQSHIYSDQIVIKSIKRLFGKTFDEAINCDRITPYIRECLVNDQGALKIKIYDKLLSPIDIGIMIFSKLKTQAEGYFNENIEMAVVTVPAYFDDIAKFQVKKAAELAGFTVMRMIAEPTAAAYAYKLNNKNNGCYLVYDFGGGTFDVSIVNLDAGILQVLATDGNNNLGGDDIDQAVCTYLKEKYGIFNITLDEGEVLLNVAKQLKEMLSVCKEAKISGYHLKLAEFDQITYDIITETVTIAQNLYKNADSPPLHGVILAGGSSKIECVAKSMLSNFLVPINNSIPPEKAVAYGAAIHAENLMNRSSSILVDVLPLSLGLEIMGGTVEKIIHRNTPLPVSVSKYFTTYAENQTAIVIHALQGERELAEDCKSLGKFHLPVPPLPAGIAKVMVKFSVDIDGLLTVAAIDESTNESVAINIDTIRDLTNDHIATSIKEALKYSSSDYASKLLAEAICDANISIKNIQLVLSEVCTTQENLLDLENVLDDLKQAIAHKSDHEKIHRLIKNLNTVALPILEEYYSKKVSSFLSGTHIAEL